MITVEGARAQFPAEYWRIAPIVEVLLGLVVYPGQEAVGVVAGAGDDRFLVALESGQRVIVGVDGGGIAIPHRVVLQVSRRVIGALARVIHHTCRPVAPAVLSARM
jgi:hypothetical protein